jgi:hypothetical protein
MLNNDRVPVYEITPHVVSFWRRTAGVVTREYVELPDWAVVGAGALFFLVAGMLTGAWLHI